MGRTVLSRCTALSVICASASSSGLWEWQLSETRGLFQAESKGLVQQSSTLSAGSPHVAGAAVMNEGSLRFLAVVGTGVLFSIVSSEAVSIQQFTHTKAREPRLKVSL